VLSSVSEYLFANYRLQFYQLQLYYLFYFLIGLYITLLCFHNKDYLVLKLLLIFEISLWTITYIRKYTCYSHIRNTDCEPEHSKRHSHCESWKGRRQEKQVEVCKIMETVMQARKHEVCRQILTVSYISMLPSGEDRETLCAIFAQPSLSTILSCLR
jgi:hypothetical protein